MTELAARTSTIAARHDQGVDEDAVGARSGVEIDALDPFGAGEHRRRQFGEGVEIAVVRRALSNMARPWISSIIRRASSIPVGRQAEGDILQNLDKHPEAEHHRRAKTGSRTTPATASTPPVTISATITPSSRASGLMSAPVPSGREPARTASSRLSRTLADLGFV